MIDPLKNSLGFQIAVAARSMKRDLENRLIKYKLTSSQYVVLELLWQSSGLSLSDLGKMLYFDNPTITGIINRMARAKLIRRHRTKNDRRVVKVYLTPKGQSLSTILPGVAEEVNSKAMDDFTSGEKKQILKLTKLIHSNLKKNT